VLKYVWCGQVSAHSPDPKKPLSDCQRKKNKKNASETKQKTLCASVCTPQFRSHFVEVFLLSAIVS
jgi:hypothetical protein